MGLESMGVSDKSIVYPRLKREDCTRTKHDAAFSDWKILIGPSDWDDYLMNKDGAEKYRTQNLSNCSSCPGLYELGIAESRPQSGREFAKLRSNNIIPVYLGQANNVRTRLQSYGRKGSHLETGFPYTDLNDTQGQGLFTEIFSRGFPIVYRWAPMKSKKDAEETEVRLLNTFDYAWNRGCNGARRPNDIYHKLNRSTVWSHPIIRKLQNIGKKEVGLKIIANEDDSSFNINEESNNFLSRILKFNRTRPRLVSDRFDAHKDGDNICGVALGHGYVCTKPPVEGRKRCSEHKGMKVNASNSMSKINSQMNSPSLSDSCSHKLHPSKCAYDEEISLKCGVVMLDGSLCATKSARGRKRCEEHKGMRVHGSVSKFVEKYNAHSSDLDSRSLSDESELIYCRTKEMQSSSSLLEEKSIVNKNYVKCEESGRENLLTCGAKTVNGSFCRRKPGKNSKWCWQHHGKENS